MMTFKNFKNSKQFILSLLTIFLIGLSACQKDTSQKEYKKSSDPLQYPPTGAMWMPHQIKELEPVLKKLGVELSGDELSNPNSDTLSSIISLGGCSASFVSNDGLIITNHHCVSGYVQHLTTDDRNNGVEDTDYKKNGFHARTKTEERNVGPSGEVNIIQKITDVSARVLEGVESIEDPIERAKLIETRRKKIIAELENTETGKKAEVTSFFRGEKYFAIEKLQIKDLRAVYIPPEQIGYYGGDTRNWEYPRPLLSGSECSVKSIRS